MVFTIISIYDSSCFAPGKINENILVQMFAADAWNRRYVTFHVPNVRYFLHTCCPKPVLLCSSLAIVAIGF